MFCPFHESPSQRDTTTWDRLVRPSSSRIMGFSYFLTIISEALLTFLTILGWLADDIIVRTRSSIPCDEVRILV
jgi:hypothetical protein